jgi:hypothetical protein
MPKNQITKLFIPGKSMRNSKFRGEFEPAPKFHQLNPYEP